MYCLRLNVIELLATQHTHLKTNEFVSKIYFNLGHVLSGHRHATIH